MERKFVFISHANPQDNYFSAWLASKLRVLGYEVWLDINDIAVGTAFNSHLQSIIQKESIVFIAVNSEAYAEKAEDQYRGVAQELNCAKTVDIKEIGHNFIIPIRIDDLDFSKFPYHIQGWNTIDFYNNWQNGLIKLVEELEKLNVPKQKNIINPTNLWFQAIKSENKVIKREETYYSNWFEVEKPEFVYIHDPVIFNEEEVANIPHPLITEAKHIISFFSEETAKKYINVRKTYTFQFDKLKSLEVQEVSDIFLLIEPKKKLVKLLNECFIAHLRTKGLLEWEKSTRNRLRNLFYFPKPSKGNISDYINLKRYGFSNSRRRRLIGSKVTKRNRKNNKGEYDIIRERINWSFAISASCSIEDEAYYKIYYTIVCMDKDFKILGKKLQHKYRRSIASDWFNRKWLEMLLASMLKISPNYDSNKIIISVDENENIYINNEPFKVTSDIGYKEPKND